MSQFDFFIISKLTIVFAAVAIFIAFFVLFSVVAPIWLTKMVRVLFKAGLIAETQRFRALVNHFNAAGVLLPLSFDLLEQFLLKINTIFSILILLVIIFAPIAFSFLIFFFLLEMLLEFVGSVMRDVLQEEAINFSRDLVGLSTIFICVLTGNVLGILPYSFTTTGSLAAPFLFSLTVLFIYFFILITKFKLSAFAGFLPAGTNIYIAPLIVLIEFISTFAKFASLGIRLFANMFAGHLLLKVFYTIGFKIVLGLSFVLGLAETIVTVLLFVIVILEIMIAFLQSFVMLLLTILYFKEAENFINAH